MQHLDHDRYDPGLLRVAVFLFAALLAVSVVVWLKATSLSNVQDDIIDTQLKNRAVSCLTLGARAQSLAVCDEPAVRRYMNQGP